jgi:predicted tellurium resistance membrane protein TerC
VQIESLTALATLTALEIVLGIDNLIFISIVSSRVHPDLQRRVRTLGIGLALVFRLGLLFSIGWIMSLTQPLLNIAGRFFSGRDLILIAGGLFLLVKATSEMHKKIEHSAKAEQAPKAGSKKALGVFFQIIALDLVFSLDSVITAVGMANEIWVMITAMVVAVGVMLLFANTLHRIIQRHPTLAVLALSFLLLIGMTLTIEGMGGHVDKSYLYFAMAFSLAVELLNIRFGARQSSR